MDQAHRETDKELATLERRIRKVYSEAQQDVQQKLDSFTAKFQQKDQLYAEKLRKGEITEAQYRAWRQGQVFQGKQWQSKLTQLTDTVVHADQVAWKLINGQVDGVFANNANWQSYVLEHAGGLDFGFELYDADTVARLLREQPKLLPKRKVDIPKDQRWSQTAITRQITQGIIQGESLDQIAHRLQKVTTMSRNSSLTNARTAMTGAQNAGRQESLHRAAAMGIRTKRRWLSTLDGHTRTEHRRLDGQVVDLDEPFEIDGYKIMFPGDPKAHPAMVYNCRCTEIGELVDYPPELNTQRYDNIDGKPIKDMTYQEWYEAKTGKPLVKKPVKTVEKPKKPDPKKVLQLNGIRGKLKAAFVDKMQDILDNGEHPYLRDMYYKFGDDLRVIDGSYRGGAHFNRIDGGIRFSQAKDVKGDTCHVPYQTVFHEFGHNIDYLAGEGGDRYYSIVYKNGKLGRTIKSDYENYLQEYIYSREDYFFDSASDLRYVLRAMDKPGSRFFRDLADQNERGEISIPEILRSYRRQIVDYQMQDSLTRAIIRDQARKDFLQDIKDEGRTLYAVGSLSDILEGCTGISYPLGVGHGATYHTRPGATAKEFFAEVCDAEAVNPESLEQLQRVFPNAVKLVDEMIKKVTK